MNILKDLLNNAALLLSLWVIFALAPYKKAVTNQFIRKVLLGLFIGLIGVAIMMNPLTFAPGIRFDARSILLSISGLFFGFIPTSIAAVITIIFRLYLGGAGTFTGVIIILTSAAVGLCWRHFRRKRISNPKWLELYLFGIIIHILMLITLLTLPHEYAVDAIHSISFSLLLIYPIVTVLLGKLLSQQKNQQELALELAAREEQYRLIIETTEEGICLLDAQDRFIFVNQKFADLIGYSISEIKTKTLQEFISEEFKQWYRTNQKKRLAGIREQYELCLVNKEGKPIWTLVSASPIIGRNGVYDGSLGTYTDITQRKENESTLQHLGKIFDDSLNEIYIYDYDSLQLLQANRAARENLGYTLEELQQLSLVELGLEFSHQPYMELLADLKNGTAQEKVFQASHIRKDGSVYITEYRLQLSRVGPKPVFIAYVIDITERKKIEDDLKKSQERFKLAFETSPDSININRAEDGLYIDINEGFTTITGYTREDIIGKTSLEINIWRNPEDRQKLVKGLREHGYVSNMEAEFQLKNGDVVTALMSARIIMLDDVPHILSITREIEEYKRTELALRESENKYRTLFQELVSGFALHEMIYNENGAPIDYRFLEINPAFERLTGLSANDILGKTVLEVLPETEEYWIETYGEVVKTKQTIRFENYAKNFRKYYEVTAFAVDENQFATIFLDITDRKISEQEIQRSRKQLRALTSYLQTAIEEERKNIAREIHDVFGQLMTALKMDLSWLNRHSGEQKELQQRFESMNELVDQAIVTARRISSELRPGLLDDLGLLAALEWYTGEFSNRADIECILNLPESIPEITTELETALYRIFQEVLTNVARHANATTVKIDLMSNHELTLMVHDNGRGITPNELENQQSLGLLGMRERAGRWGGTIEIMGEPDKGTKVIIKIPLSPQMEERETL